MQRFLKHITLHTTSIGADINSKTNLPVVLFFVCTKCGIKYTQVYMYLHTTLLDIRHLHLYDLHISPILAPAHFSDFLVGGVGILYLYSVYVFCIYLFHFWKLHFAVSLYSLFAAIRTKHIRILI